MLMLERERILRELNSQNPGYDPDDVEPPPPPPPELPDEESSLSSAEDMYPPPPPPFTESFPSPSCSPAAPVCLTASPANPEPCTSFDSVSRDPSSLQRDSSSTALPATPLQAPIKKDAEESFDSPVAKRPRMDGCPFSGTQFSEESPAVNDRKSTYNDDNVVSDADVSNEANNSQAQSVENSGDSDLSDDSDDDFVDGLLEKTLDESRTVKNEEDLEIKSKRVLEHRGCDHFDVLPEGWVEVSHESGLSVYLHRKLRVCTFSRPYFLGTGSVRHHKVPQTAIPCFFQRKVREQVEQREKEIDELIKSHKETESSAHLIAKLQAPEVKTVQDFEQSQLTPDDLHDYAKTVFKFKTINVHRDRTWASHRMRIKDKKRADAEMNAEANAASLDCDRPVLPSDVKLITIPSLDQNGKPQRKNFLMNPQGKTSVSVLHEYVQKVVKSTIRYHYEETRSSSNPYIAIAYLKLGQISGKATSAVSIKEKIMLLHEQQRREGLKNSSENTDEVFLGKGSGVSKKLAKLRAAVEAVSILIPGIEFDSEGMVVNSKKETGTENNANEDVISMFNKFDITHERIPELCSRSGQPAPFLVLQECLKRYSASADTKLSISSTRQKHHRHEFVMSVGKHETKVICTNKQEGKQRASQQMLQLLHPELKTWGEIIRMYGYEAQRQFKDARKKGNDVTKLQALAADGSSKVSLNPNAAILSRLNEEMRKTAERVGQLKGPFRPDLSNDETAVTDWEVALSAQYSEIHRDRVEVPIIDL
ncbi:hypothetical protein L596_000629 [Steinernema carpocapsae]|uniref:DRBM domain-containing protein n=1 Tax=Steinernema carpocapsae TaxID=34508 RepID=A0A4U8UMW3_STECR|nr:hypothetical protein L596_000629 [Steinernema carpocapsae]